MKKYAKTALRILISISLIAFLIKTQDFAAIKSGILSFNPYYLIIAGISLFVGTYVSSIRWRTILKTTGKDISEWYLFNLYLKGYFYNNFLPTQMGGDVYKSVALGNTIKDQPAALFSVFMDRFGGLIILLILSLFGIGSLYGYMGAVISFALLVVGLLLYFPVLKLFAKKIKFLQKFEKASKLFIEDKQNGFLVLLYSFLVQVFSFFTTYCLFLGVGIVLPLWSVIAFMPIAAISLLIPSFNGFGTQETVYAYLFAAAGVTPELSITASIMNHALRLIFSLLGGALILFNLGKGSKQNA